MASAALYSRRKKLLALATVTRCIANNEKLPYLFNSDSENLPREGSDDAALLEKYDVA